MVAVLAGFLVFQQLHAQESLEAELERYEAVCRMSMELKDRIEEGEQISRNQLSVIIRI